MAAKVLIVEDEFLIGMELEMTLQERGYDVVGVAVDYDSAVSHAADEPEIALVDVNLRDGPTGPLIAQELASGGGTSIVFVTANPRQISTSIAGALGIVIKPAENDLVAAAVDYALAVREGQCTFPPAGLVPLTIDQSASQ